LRLPVLVWLHHPPRRRILRPSDGRCRRSTGNGSVLRSADVGASSSPQLSAWSKGALGRPPDPHPVLSSYPSTPSHGRRRRPRRGCRRAVGRGAAVREHPHRRRGR
jgi:hypothetical protein